MKLIDTEDTILIVTGTEIPAEMNDRPLAYRLKAEIDRRGAGKTYRGAVVVSDGWFAQNRIFHLCAVIAVGGPGVNTLAASLVEELPMMVRRDDKIFVQGKWDGEEKRVSLWGMDRYTTAEAVEVFIKEGHCEAFLRAAWKTPSAARSGTDLA